MSRYIDADALIESIKNTADLGGWIGEALYQIKQVAIKYIDSAPTIEPKRGKPDFADCEKCLRTYGTLGCCSTVSNEWVYSCLEGMLEKAYADGIKSVEPKRGEWIDNTSETWTPSKKCSECGLVVHSVATDSTDFHAKTKMNFCPNCGADMRKGADDGADNI